MKIFQLFTLWEVSLAVVLAWAFWSGQIAYGQTAFATAGQANLQSATLENILLLQNMRDSDYYCPRTHTWFLGYGAGGYRAGENIFTENNTSTTTDEKFDQSFAGFLLGVDKQLRDHLRLGAFFSYNNTRLENSVLATGEETVNMNNFFWGGYGRKNLDYNTYFLGTIAGGHSHLQENRTNNQADFYSGRSNAWRALLYGEFGKEYRFAKTTLQPLWGIQYFHNTYGSTLLAKNGSTENADMASPLKTNSLRNILGVRVSQLLKSTHSDSLRFDCLGFWYHEYLNSEKLGGIQIYNSDGNLLFEESGAYSGRDWAVVAPTLEWQHGNIRFWAGYLAMFNHQETIQLGQGGFGLCW